MIKSDVLVTANHSYSKGGNIGMLWTYAKEEHFKHPGTFLLLGGKELRTIEMQHYSSNFFIQG